jgi:uncharacterized membrane protein
MNSLKKFGWVPYAIILLGLAGLSVSIYLSIKEATGAEIGSCPIFGTGCGDVLHSEYSRLFGVPLAYFGVLFYTLITILGSAYAFTKKIVLKRTIALFSVIGFIDSVGFIYIQGVLIGAYCFYCVISAITSTLLFFVMLPTIIDNILTFTENSKHKEEGGQTKNPE